MSEEARYVVYATEDKNEYHVDGPDVVEERVTVTVLTLTELLGRVFEAGHQLGLYELSAGAANQIRHLEQYIGEKRAELDRTRESVGKLLKESISSLATNRAAVAAAGGADPRSRIERKPVLGMFDNAISDATAAFDALHGERREG